MDRYFIRIKFDGTAYHGWQVQGNAITVQSVLEKCLSALFGKEIRVTGCGRTDTGVHAREFFAHFDSPQTLDEAERSKMVFRLNAFLPDSIAVTDLIPVLEGAHARFHAVSRTYEYHFSRTKDPFAFATSFYLFGDLDVALMNAGAEILKEYSDFSAFSKSHTQVKTNNCKIFKVWWEEKDEKLVFTITADRFLRNMVRAIVGTMLELGRHQMDLERFRNVIEGKNRSDAGMSVPACGLFLVKVEYPAEIFIIASSAR